MWFKTATCFVIPSLIITMIWASLAHNLRTEYQERGVATRGQKQGPSKHAQATHDQFFRDLVTKVTLKMVLITGFFLVSVTPVCIMWILVGVTLQPEHGENFNGPFVVVFFNSLVQPFLYLGINKSLRGALSACCKFKSPDGSQK